MDNSTRDRKREEQTFAMLWDYAFQLENFAYAMLSADMQQLFKAENEELRKAAERWMSKLYKVSTEKGREEEMSL